MSIVWSNERAVIGANGEWEEVPLADALERVTAGELYECAKCEMDGQYGDGLRTFHPTSGLSSGDEQERHEQAKEN